eukprot:1938899-Heterocapsa_arctica.AAC.1
MRDECSRTGLNSAAAFLSFSSRFLLVLVLLASEAPIDAGAADRVRSTQLRQIGSDRRRCGRSSPIDA